MGHSFLKMVHPDDQDSVMTQLNSWAHILEDVEVLKTGDSWIMLDGTKGWDHILEDVEVLKTGESIVG